MLGPGYSPSAGERSAAVRLLPLAAAGGQVRKQRPDPLRPDPRIRITLWGFGVFYGSAGSGGLFLKRRSFSPLLTPQPDPGGAWSQADLPPVHSPASREECRTARRLLCGVLGWIAEYERWVRAELGPDHRRLCVAEWPKAALPADEMAEGWLKLARFFEEEESA